LIYLFLSILLSTFLGVIFVYFNKHKIDIFQAIVFNYWVCVITGSLVLGNFPIHTNSVQTDWFKMSIIMGVLFISVFNLIGISSVLVGATITQTANKLSLTIPVVVSYFLYHENISLLKMIGILLALIAVILTMSKKSSGEKKKIPLWEFSLPIVLFVSSGVVDSITKYVQNKYLISEAISKSYIIAGFMVAAIIGSVILLFLYITGRKKFEFKNVLAGIILGVPNYFSIYYLIKALQNKSMNSSATIPINNIGVLFLVSIFGIFIFKEKLTRLNYIGLGLTLLAILFIFLGDS
jgi:drug/metabolite transporter (DMT)-like permease